VTETADFCDMRVLTPQELSLIIVEQRQQRGWTQATLAKLSRLTERTIQRIEGGEPSSVDTRRALASRPHHADRNWAFSVAGGTLRWYQVRRQAAQLSRFYRAFLMAQPSPLGSAMFVFRV
jgi:transcriptional regulator with XRE-family HTH domain